jgi:hypothetical protein
MVRGMGRRFGGFAAAAFGGLGRREALADLGQLPNQFLKLRHFAFIGHLLLLGVLDQFEDLLHVVEGTLEGVDHPFHLKDGLLDGTW